jgi:hypothetical protein
LVAIMLSVLKNQIFLVYFVRYLISVKNLRKERDLTPTT